MNNHGNILRYLTYLKQSGFFYFYCLIFSFFVFGFGGILPLSINIFKKASTINLAKTVITNFQKKEVEVERIKEDYSAIQPYLYFLDIYMPTDINVDDYLIGLNAISVSNGFSVKRMSPVGQESNNSIVLNVAIEGYGNLANLIKDIENLKRVTKITMVEVTKVKGRDRIELSLQIFSR